MTRGPSRSPTTAVLVAVAVGALVLVPSVAGAQAAGAAKGAGAARAAGVARPAGASPLMAKVLRGRQIVITHDCAGCHGGVDPSMDGWLIGSTGPETEFKIGPCAVTPGATPCFTTRPRNLTPDNETGLGRFTERQIYNALKYGLRPEDTPDVVITSTTPGQGNFPAHPHYLAVPMPWTVWRLLPDADLWAIAAYLKNGLKPVSHKVPESEGPPDFWASAYTPDKIGQAKIPAFPAAHEQSPESVRAQR